VPSNEVIIRSSACTEKPQSVALNGRISHTEYWLLTIRESAALLWRGSVLISDCHLVLCFALVCWINDTPVFFIALQAIVSGLSQVQFVFVVWTECVALC
jgi:hypothetical protein